MLTLNFSKLYHIHVWVFGNTESVNKLSAKKRVKRIHGLAVSIEWSKWLGKYFKTNQCLWKSVCHAIISWQNYRNNLSLQAQVNVYATSSLCTQWTLLLNRHFITLSQLKTAQNTFLTTDGCNSCKNYSV